MSTEIQVGLAILAFVAYLAIMNWKAIKANFVSQRATAPTTPTPVATSATASADVGNGSSRVIRLALIVLGAVVALGVIAWLWPTETVSLKAPAPGAVWEFAKTYWLWVLIVAGLLYALAPFILNGKPGETLQVAVIVVTVMLFCIVPLVHLFWGEKSSSPQVAQQAAPRQMQVLPQDADVPWAWKTPSAQWPRIHVPPHGDSVRVPALFGGHIVWGGQGFTVHCIYEDGHEGISGDENRPCHSGTMVAAWARNDGDTPLYASYAYARKGEP